MIACFQCGKDFEVKSAHGLKRKFCSAKCRSDSHGCRAGKNARYRLPSGTVGTISELRVCEHLLLLGFEVFRAVSPSCSCDLMALKNGKAFRVEVKTGRQILNERQKGRADILALVLPETIDYIPSLQSLESL